MSWFGDMQSDLEETAKGIQKYAPGTLGWLLSVNEWNRLVWDGGDAGEIPDWDDIWQKGKPLPTNCEWETPDEGDPKYQIKIPKFDMNQHLSIE